jgi:ferritin
MISSNMARLINDQINRELYSSYFYLALAAQAEGLNMKGTAAWFQAKHEEEMDHGLKMYRYLLDQDAQVSFRAIDAPPSESGGVLDMFELTLEHERSVTASINELVDAALSEKDHATNVFLQWFVTEQIEEEATVKDIIGRLRLVGDDGRGLFMLDSEMASLAAQVSQADTTA